MRVPELSEAAIKQVLDLGARGVIVPQVNSADEAKRVVEFARYSPHGSRGVGLGRAHKYGLGFQDYVESANQEVVVVVQAEHVDAVNDIERITDVEGIDVVLIGPYDLSASVNKMGQVDDEEVVSMIQKVTECCQRRGIPLGIFGVTAESIAIYAKQGFSLVVAGTDTILLGSSAGSLLKKLKQL